MVRLKVKISTGLTVQTDAISIPYGAIKRLH